MSVTETLDARADHLADLIEKKFGVRGKTLEAKLTKAGRLLPKWARKEAHGLIQAQQFAAHPKLAMQMDTSRLDKGLRRCESWLKSIDPAKRRKDRILALLGTNAANILIVATGFVAYLVWAGHV